MYTALRILKQLLTLFEALDNEQHSRDTMEVGSLCSVCLCRRTCLFAGCGHVVLTYYSVFCNGCAVVCASEIK